MLEYGSGRGTGKPSAYTAAEDYVIKAGRAHLRGEKHQGVALYICRVMLPPPESSSE